MEETKLYNPKTGRFIKNNPANRKRLNLLEKNVKLEKPEFLLEGFINLLDLVGHVINKHGDTKLDEVHWKHQPRYFTGFTEEMRINNVIEMGEDVSSKDLDQLVYPFPEITLEASKFFRVDRSKATKKYKKEGGFTNRDLFEIILDFERYIRLKNRPDRYNKWEYEYIVGLKRGKNDKYRVKHL
jgi:hypothetical protein